MSCVVAKKHPYKHQVAKAFVVLKDGIEPTEKLKEEIMNYCMKDLAKYSLPAEIEFKKNLPKTLVGKVAYTELLEEDENEK